MRASFLFAVLVGIAMGIAAAILAPTYLGPYLPEAIGPKYESIEGTVQAKLMRGEELLLTVDTPQGAVLVTFKSKASEIDMLVSQGDLITIGLKKYAPFVHDPPITRVRKSKGAPAAVPEARAVPETPKAAKQPPAPPASPKQAAPAPEDTPPAAVVAPAAVLPDEPTPTGPTNTPAP